MDVYFLPSCVQCCKIAWEKACCRVIDAQHACRSHGSFGSRRTAQQSAAHLSMRRKQDYWTPSHIVTPPPPPEGCKIAGQQLTHSAQKRSLRRLTDTGEKIGSNGPTLYCTNCTNKKWKNFFTKYIWHYVRRKGNDSTPSSNSFLIIICKSMVGGHWMKIDLLFLFRFWDSTCDVVKCKRWTWCNR